VVAGDFQGDLWILLEHYFFSLYGMPFLMPVPTLSKNQMQSDLSDWFWDSRNKYFVVGLKLCFVFAENLLVSKGRLSWYQLRAIFVKCVLCVVGVVLIEIL